MEVLNASKYIGRKVFAFDNVKLLKNWSKSSTLVDIVEDALLQIETS